MLHCRMNASKVERRSSVFVYVARGAGIPLVAVALAVDVQVRAGNFYAVGVPVWRTIKVQPHENNRCPRPVLVGSFRKLDLRAGHIEHETFPLVE